MPTLAVLLLYEREGIDKRLGPRGTRELERALDIRVAAQLADGELATREGDGSVSLLFTDAAAARARIDALMAAIASAPFRLLGAEVFVTPAVGYTDLTLAGLSTTAAGLAAARTRARVAAVSASSQNDMRPLQFDPDMIPANAPPVLTRSTFRRIRDRLRLPLQIAATFAFGLGLPLGAYVAFDRFGIDLTAITYPLVVAVLVTAGTLIWAEGLAAMRQTTPPPFAGEYPVATAIISAYLPNEAATVLETVAAFRALDYPRLQIIVVYNTPRDLPVEVALRERAAEDPRLELLRVDGSSSKAQNVNAALDHVAGEFVGLFDADHHPAAGSFERAWAWLASGFDIVQGHNVVRRGETSLLSRIIAVEFESIYASSHPGRNRMHGFGIFGGSNGFWRTELLRETRMRGTMLTEDIDSSLRVVRSGRRIASDRWLISTELPPPTMRALWAQRSRWAQGWFQASLRHAVPTLRSGDLTLRQKLGVFHLLVFRELYPWVSLQILPIVGFWVLVDHAKVDWRIPLFVATSIFTLTIGPSQAFFAYRSGHRSIRTHRWWFLWYIAAGFFYAEFKNVVTRVAQLKEAMGEDSWDVTPRLGAPMAAQQRPDEKPADAQVAVSSEGAGAADPVLGSAGGAGGGDAAA